MWTIGEVKRLGWEKVKKYYWQALVVVIIAGLFSGGGGGSGFNAGVNSNSGNKIAYELNDVTLDLGISSGEVTNSIARRNPISSSLKYLATSIAITTVLVIMLIVFLLKFFVGNVLLVGKNRFFMESRSLNASAGVGKIGWVFGCGHYMNVVKIMFLRDLYTLLWTLLLVVPGIIKSYEYQMIPYILSENPEADSKDVFALTRDMMSGSKFHYFVLQLSFIGWYLLGFLACCVGMIFVCPYEEAAYAEVYTSMRRNINDFPFNGYGVEETEDVYQKIMNSNARYGDDVSGEDDSNRY